MVRNRGRVSSRNGRKEYYIRILHVWRQSAGVLPLGSAFVFYFDQEHKSLLALGQMFRHQAEKHFLKAVI
jgi:hypothetical protein